MTDLYNYIDRIDRKGGREDNSAREKAPDVHDESSSCVCSPKWLNLFNHSLKEIEGRGIGGRWYVITGTPMTMLHWKEIFFDAVLHGATINFAYQSAISPDSCFSMQAQWRMNIEHLQDPDPIGLLKQRLRDGISQLRALARKAIDKKSKGAFQFFESFITHPYVAILIVPESPKDKPPTQEGAPPGTICLLGHYTFYPRSLEDRLGICLSQPSPLLDIYYNSITRLFEQGPKDNYLRTVNLYDKAHFPPNPA